MNRSFRAQESQMQAATKQRQLHAGNLRASAMKDKEEELALFLEMKKREKERNELLLNSSEEFDAPLAGSRPGTSPIFNISSTTTAPARKNAVDEFLNSENDKNDYEWLLTPPGTPLFPSLEMEAQKTIMSQLGTPKARRTVLKSRLANPQQEMVTRSDSMYKQQASSHGMNTSTSNIRAPSSSGVVRSRPATPTGRPTLTQASKPSRSSTPTSRATLPLTKPMSSSTRTSVTTTKPSVPASKSTIPSRSSTPIRSTVRSSTPTSRPTLPASKPTSRAVTPTRRLATLSNTPSTSASGVRSSSTISKPAPTALQNAVPSRGTSPTVKSRPWRPLEMPGFSLDAPPNLRTTLPDRPLSATRGRPGAPSPRSSSVEPGSNGRPRRQSCSPSRGRAPSGAVHPSGSSVPAMNRGPSKVSDSLSPVLVGTKMVERVINMRKLVPPKQDDKHSPLGTLSGKSSSPESLGFGRTLSKKSLDMAIRHMDLRRTIPSNLRPLMTKIPASSMYSIRSGSGPVRSRTISVSGSPLATSSNASSELSVNNNGLFLDTSEVEDDIGSHRGLRSPASFSHR